jgi:hypothetical protein
LFFDHYAGTSSGSEDECEQYFYQQQQEQGGNNHARSGKVSKIEIIPGDVLH